MSAIKKLAEAKFQLHSQELKKTGNNQGRLFFELGDFLPQTLDIFHKIGLLGTVSFPAGRAILTIYDTDDEASKLEFESPFGSAALKGCHEVQNIGAVETYQRRYLWMDAMDIIEHDGLESATNDGFDVKPYFDDMEASTDIDMLRTACKLASDAIKDNGGDRALMTEYAKIRSACMQKLGIQPKPQTGEAQ